MGKYSLTIEEQVDDYYYSEISRCKNCNHPIEEMYHNIFRHISDTKSGGIIAGKDCNLCNCKKPEKQ